MRPHSEGRRRQRLRSRLGVLGGLALGVGIAALPRLLNLGKDATVAIYTAVALAGCVALLYRLATFPTRWRRHAAQAAAWRTLRCVNCNYDLRGLQVPTCPECGRESPELARWLADAPEVLRASRSADPDA